jgi:PAS domain S-box-containing protein
MRARSVTISGRRHLMGLVRDITREHAAAEALRESEERYRSVFNEARDGIVLVDATGLIVDGNSEFERQTGRSLQELRKAKVWELRPPAEVDGAKALYFRGHEKGRFGPIEQHFQRPDGAVVTVEISARMVMVGAQRLMQGMTRDITKRKRAEEALREKEERLRLVVEQTPAVLWTTDRNLRFTSSVGSGLKALGLEPGQVVGMTVFEYFQTDDPDILPIAVHRTALQGESATYETEWNDSFFESHTEPLRNDDGDIIGVIGIALDITERKKAETALRESETSLRQIVDLVPHMIFAKARDGRFLLVNHAVAHAYGKKADELVDSRHDEVHATRDELDGYLRDDREVINSGRPKFIPEETFLDVYGNQRVLQTTKIPYIVPGSGERAVLGVSVDITERKRVEDRLKESKQQLRALALKLQEVREEEAARLAREIHDELGQTLTGFKMDIRWLMRRINEMEQTDHCQPIVERLKGMSEEADRSIQAVREISTTLRPVILDYLGLMRALEWQARDFEERTGIVCDFHLNKWEHNVDQDRSTAVFRIFQEILTNVARHADARHVEITLGHQDDDIILDVADDGKGISEDDMTSFHALGILGMRERAHMCGGHVSIRRRNGNGTRVRVRIPVDGGGAAATTS